MRKVLYVLFAIVLSIALYPAQESEAAPTFARQTGMACNTCHFQHFPTLNAFGRAFKSGGYTQIGGQSLVEGDLLSLPSTLNASLVTKLRYQKTNGDTEGVGSGSATNYGEVQFPDEASLLIGGRAGEHVGFLLEAQLIDNTAPAFASYKMPVVYNVADTNVSVIPFTTDSQGASYGFELLNTGALRLQRPMEHRDETSAQQYIRTDGAATGVAFVAANSLWHVNYSLWAPVHGNNNASPHLNYLRAAVTPTVQGWDLGVGFQLWKGTTKYTKDATPTNAKADAFAVDAQLQGTAANMPLGVYLTYATAKKSDATGAEPANIFNSNTVNDERAWILAAELGVMPGKLTIEGAYRSGKKGNTADDSDNAITLGANYTLAQNVSLHLQHSLYSGSLYDTPQTNGDAKTTLMIFAAF